MPGSTTTPRRSTRIKAAPPQKTTMLSFFAKKANSDGNKSPLKSKGQLGLGINTTKTKIKIETPPKVSLEPLQKIQKDNKKDVAREEEESISPRKSKKRPLTETKISVSDTEDEKPNKLLRARRTSSSSLNNKKEKTTVRSDTDEEEKEPKKTTRPRRAASRSKKTTIVMSDTEEEEEEEEEQEPMQKTRRLRKALTPKKKKKKIVDSDSDFSDNVIVTESNSDEEIDFDSESASERELTEEEEKPAAGLKKKSLGKGKGSNPPSRAEKKKEGSRSQEFADKLAKDLKGFKPNNNPQKLPLKEYVDPVGVDPTHGIVEGIMATQVRKIGGLLEIAMKEKEMFPIRLQTACSGTDAPSIALGIIQETLQKLRPNLNFEYSHEMSCEIEPFKQAYIGRNFPGVVLFPDITKLTSGPTVKDVYGRPQSVPDGNMFVAGTSCKDFSMLKTRDRIDIEDKGTSGETFLAAVEFLEEKQPQIAIFENVDGAPWGKMQEYIRGRIDLKNRNEMKAITAYKKGEKPDADKDLLFSVTKDGRYVAEAVPRQVGIRAGTVLQGFVRGDDDDDDEDNEEEILPLRPDKELKVGAQLNLGKLAKKHGINLKKDILVLEKKARYCTHLCKLDTKEYGLPQTRNRKYLFIWRSDDPHDNLGEYFQDIMEHLKTPLLHSMDAFLLADTHDRIRCFREALRSGPGLMVKRERARELDFWNWDESHVKDLTLHLAFRQNCGIAEKSRWLTGWETRGRKRLAPGLWPELFDCWNHRRLDMVDCFAAAAVRDAISRDPLHHSFTWDLSQNVTRAPFRSATVGVSGCVTPGGELLLPFKGRTVMGYEKLLLQGIPYSRLLLGPETEVQLSDLAGNAMSVPVVGAVQLASLCAAEWRRQSGDFRKQGRKEPKKRLDTFSLQEAGAGELSKERGDLLYDANANNHAGDFMDVFQSILKDLGHDAYLSSVLCTCESSGTTSASSLLQCTSCGWGVCHGCSSRYQTESHCLYEFLTIDEKKRRMNPHEFERRLRRAVPSVLTVSLDVPILCHYSFRLQEVLRQRGQWRLTYGAWEDHGSGRQVAEIRVLIGKLGILDRAPNVAAYLRNFAPAIRGDNPQRGRLADTARWLGGGSVWQIPQPSVRTQLNVVGSGECPSQRALVGLGQPAATGLKTHTVQKQFRLSVKSRNQAYFYEYPPRWQVWPDTIDISGDDRVKGTYQKQTCRHTVVSSALWYNESSQLYLYIRPNMVRSGLDAAVISTTPSYHDGKEICELLDWMPENSMNVKTHSTEATFFEWKDTPSFKVTIPSEGIQVTAPASFGAHEKDNPSLLCEMKGISAPIVDSLLEFSSHKNELDLFGRCGTRTAKRLSIVAAPSLLKFAAERRLPISLQTWYPLVSFDPQQTEKYVPTRPCEIWKEAAGRNQPERVYDNEESNEYYQKLFHRPTAFQVHVSSEGIRVNMNPHVVAHQAASELKGDQTKLQVEYCLSELASMGEPDTKEFRVPNSDPYEPQPVQLEFPLYPRQAKALTRMLSIEAGHVLFPEEERAEIVLPGIGWCLQGRAFRNTPLRGGVLGDAIGSGKTVVTIALIHVGASKARANCDVHSGRSGATLIVVPPSLVNQWDDERKKFTKNKLKCIIIRCTADLKRYSIEQICRADIVIVPAGLIEEENKGKGDSRPYTANLSKVAGSNRIPDAPQYYSQKEAPTIEGTWVRNMASGPEIYVGNKGDQRKREMQAYYGHCYSEAIAKLRQKKFDPSDKSIPLEYYTWERIVIDECHETLVTGKSHEVKADFKDKARRGAREFLGVSQTDVSKRPLVAATGVWGLTGTPLLETEARVTELANLMGGTYLTGASHHWRKEERESGRDLFLNQQVSTRSREYRCAVQEACHSYVREACQRNKGEELVVKKTVRQRYANMTVTEGKAFLKATKDMQLESYTITPDQLGEKAGDVLSITASSSARHPLLLDTLNQILENEQETKILIFANSSYGGYDGAVKALKSSGRPFSHVNETDTVERQNEIIGWFRHMDSTPEEKARPRVLLLSFEQAAGHNLQEACHNVILFDPMYSGTDAVADASVEEQAVGRVMRQGQTHDVTVTRIVVRGPDGQKCVDDWIVERNLDEDVLRAATSNFD